MAQEQLSGDIRETLKSLIDPAFDAIDKAIDLVGEDAVVLYLQGKYDQYIVPVDIPYVPELAEAVIDASAKRAIGVLVKVAHARIHKAPPQEPTPGAAE